MNFDVELRANDSRIKAGQNLTLSKDGVLSVERILRDGAL